MDLDFYLNFKAILLYKVLLRISKLLFPYLFCKVIRGDSSAILKIITYQDRPPGRIPGEELSFKIMRIEINRDLSS